MNKAILVAIVLLTACSSVPKPGQESKSDADHDCRNVAYEKSGDMGWAALGIVGGLILMSKDSPDNLRKTADYQTCMVQAGYGS